MESEYELRSSAKAKCCGIATPTTPSDTGTRSTEPGVLITICPEYIPADVPAPVDISE